ncbi:GON-4-like protein isoform X2 [Pyxicephalus adspersus]|uniref:GON-4-like protein isoform X2 n=1 Tax=Pyxicephalus adspersus TaxID=30357 RepID=UPI003B5BBB1F
MRPHDVMQSRSNHATPDTSESMFICELTNPSKVVRCSAIQDPPTPHRGKLRNGLVTMQRQESSRKPAAPTMSSPRHYGKLGPHGGAPDFSHCLQGPSSPQQSYKGLGVQTAGVGGLSSAGTDPNVQKFPRCQDVAPTLTGIQTHSTPNTLKTICPPTTSTIQSNHSRATTILSRPMDSSHSQPTALSTPNIVSIQVKPTNRSPPGTDPIQVRPSNRSLPGTDPIQVKPTNRSPPGTDPIQVKPTNRSPSGTDSIQVRPTNRSPSGTDSIQVRPSNRSLPGTDPIQVKPTNRSPSGTDPIQEKPTNTSPGTDPIQERPTNRSPLGTDPIQEKPTNRSPPGTDPIQEKPTNRSPPGTDHIQVRPTNRSPAGTDPIQEKPTNRSPPGTDPIQEKPTNRSPPGTDPIQEKLTNRCPPGTDPIQVKLTNRSPPGTDPIQEKPTNRSPPEIDPIQVKPTNTSPSIDPIHVRLTNRSPPRTDPIQVKPTSRSPLRTSRSQITERRPAKQQTEFPLKLSSDPNPQPDPMAVCDKSNRSNMADGLGTPCVHSEEQYVAEDRLDGDGHSAQNNTTPQHTHHMEEEYPEEESGLYITVDEQQSDNERKRRKRLTGKRKRECKPADDNAPVSCDLDQDLDRALEDGAKQHNLTAVNVRNILHEVITNEHVVAMMKAAITETEGLPMFEPKMTRSKLKEVVEKGVVIPTWNLSPIKKATKMQAPQFVDIPLEEEDSSDEEYRPDEEEEDETAEESLLESDVESTASSPRGQKFLRALQSECQEEEAVECLNASLSAARQIGFESIPMGPPPPPKAKNTQDFTFMEKLHAVDEELERNLVSMDSFQSLDDSLIAFRTRSKRPLKDVPIGQLEAELKAPDITPDMYDHNTADDEDWKMWLCSLMQDDDGNEDEGDDDDDDDPEYNILEDWDEPDTEDLRNDRAVRITKKEVNELMEELFETFQDEMGLSHMEEEGPDDEDSNSDPLPDFNTPQAIRFEEPLANLLTEQHRTVKAQLEYLRMRKSMMKSDDEKSSARDPEFHRPPPAAKSPSVLVVDALQRKRLTQQMQQHVQLLTQLHLLTFRNPHLSMESDTARLYLVELSSFADSSALSHQQTPEFQSAFHPCNLREALELIPLVHSQVPEDPEASKQARKNGNEVSDLPKHIAWVMATQPIFMYPELLPVCAMRAQGPRDRVVFTKAEDSLLALGLKHFEGTEFSKQLISKYLLTAKTAQQLTVRIKNLTMKKSPDNVIKYYKNMKMLPPLSRCCEDVPPHDIRPPVEREKHRMPFWIKASLSSIEAHMSRLEKNPKSGRYPLLLPPAVTLTLKPLPRRFYRRLWRQKKSSVLKPLLIRPCASVTPKLPAKPAAPQAVPIRIMGQVPPLVQPAVPVHGIVNIQPVGVPIGHKGPEICSPALSNKKTAPVCGPPSAATHISITQSRMIMPATCNPRIRKSLLGGIPKIKTVPRTVGIKAAPLLPSSPLLFAVPGGALKLVNLGAPCGVLQPISGTTGVPVTTVLLNPTHMPLRQPSLSTPFQLVPKTTSVAPEVEGGRSSPKLEDSVKDEADECEYVTVQIKDEDGECDYVTVHVKDEDNPPCEGEGGPDGTLNQDGRPSDGVEEPSENKPAKETERSDVTGHVTSNHESNTNTGSGSGTALACNAAGSVQPHTAGHMGRLGQNLEGSQREPIDPKQEEPEDEPQKQASGGATDSPKNTSSTIGDEEVSSPTGAPRDSASGLSNEKDGAEEEEEEDFDDLTQDEDEMSSEESVLSVPELQETMEKLTWLASERRLSQEVDSEENSQEENTEEEEEEDAAEGSLHKSEGIMDETGEEGEKLDPSHLQVPSPAPVEATSTPAGEKRRTGTKGPNAHRVRTRRGRTRASKDASKLLLLYDDKILSKDPLREQKDMAYARSYLSRVREALHSVPGTYEQFLNIIYQFESGSGKRTAVDLYENLQQLLQDWPQLLKDFAAFLLPEQALECGLFEEQQAFEKSRRFLRQLEICFKENPAHHQKIIKLLQSCAECPLQEIGKLKTQMCHLLKGHHHLQEEFSLFFDQLRPPASRMEDFEVMSWTEDKEYKFDGFEEVTLPEVEEEEESSKVPPAQRSKRRKEATQDADWLEGGKDCPCPCHDGGAEQRLKRCKRRLCSQCSSKACDNRSQRAADSAFRQNSAGDGRSLLRSSVEEQMTAGPTHRSRSTLHSRGKQRPRDRGRGPRRPDATKDLSSMLPEKESLCSPQSHPGPCTPTMVANPRTPVAGATPCTSLTETQPPSIDNSAPQPTEEPTLPMCAKNIRLSSSGEKVVVWTREADRVILTMCQERGAHEETFSAIAAQLANKSPSEVAQRFRELINLFQTGCVTSSDEEEDEEDAAVSDED